MDELVVQHALDETLAAIASKFHRFSQQQSFAFREHLAESRHLIEQFLNDHVNAPLPEIMKLHEGCAGGSSTYSAWLQRSNGVAETSAALPVQLPGDAMDVPTSGQHLAKEEGYCALPSERTHANVEAMKVSRDVVPPERTDSHLAIVDDQAMDVGPDVVLSERTHVNSAAVEGQDQMQLQMGFDSDAGVGSLDSYKVLRARSDSAIQSHMAHAADVDYAVSSAPATTAASMEAQCGSAQLSSRERCAQEPSGVAGIKRESSTLAIDMGLSSPNLLSPHSRKSDRSSNSSNRAKRGAHSYLSALIPTRVPYRKRFANKEEQRQAMSQLTGVLRSFVVDVESDAGIRRASGNSGEQHMGLLPKWETLIGHAFSAEDHESTNTPAELDFDGSLGLQSLSSGPSMDPRHWCYMSAVHPASSKRLCWNITSIVFVLYDVVLIPMVVFDVQETVLALVVLFFWTLDIMFSFVVGYQVESKVEVRLKYSAFQYLKPWFAFDIVVIIPDWVLFCLSGEAGSGGIQRLGKLAKFFRILRGVRLLRIFRLTRAWRVLQERLTNEYLLASLEFGKLVLILVILNHYSACAWYGISKLEDHGGWVHSYELESSTWVFKYLTSLHWSMSQFHGSMEVHPVTSVERAYTLACVLVGLISASIFISSITSLLMRAQKLRQEKFLNAHMLWRYLDENRISPELTLQIKSFANRAMNASTTKVNQVELLKILPAHLLDRLYLEVKTPVIQLNSTLKLTHRLFPSVVAQICRHAVHHAFVKRGGLLFENGEKSGKMFVVWRGKVVYHLHEECGSFLPVSRDSTLSSSPSFGKMSTWMRTLSSVTGPDVSNAVVGEGKCIAEMSLWTAWHHRGDAMISGAPTVFSVDVDRYLDILMGVIQSRLELAFMLGSYAAGYMEWMRRVPSQLNDLSAPRHVDMQHHQVAFDFIK